MTMREKSFERWGEPKIYNDISDFEKSFVWEDQVISIFGGALPVDMLFQRGDSDTLFVFFNSAMEYGTEITLPVFMWLGIAEKLNSSRLFISDPSLIVSRDLFLSWYVGTRDFPAQSAIKDALSVVLRAGKKRVVFVGSSGGAYPAIYYANVFENAAAVVNAPAISLSAHHSQRALRNYAHACFGVDYRKDFFETEAPWIIADLPDFIDGRLKNPVVIMQNRDDKTYIINHVEPFLESLDLKWTGRCFSVNNVTVIPGNWGDGHCVPPRNVLISVLMEMVAHQGSDFSDLNISIPFTMDAVQIKNADGIQIAECVASEEGCEYAFYLMRDKDRVDAKWYSEKNHYVIDSDLSPGEYKVLAFARRKSDKIVASKFSQPFEVS